MLNIKSGLIKTYLVTNRKWKYFSQSNQIDVAFLGLRMA